MITLSETTLTDDTVTINPTADLNSSGTEYYVLIDATAINDTSDLSFDNLLPAVGGGIRFLAIPSSNISIGMDVAVGKDDWGLYFRIGEAFTR